jgi:CrcB protein
MDFKWIPGEEVRSFLVVGALGSFTTFSAFSQDVVFLMERGELSSAALYIALSVILSISGIYTGMILFRQILV